MLHESRNNNSIKEFHWIIENLLHLVLFMQTIKLIMKIMKNVSKLANFQKKKKIIEEAQNA